MESKSASMRFREDVLDMMDELIAIYPYLNGRPALLTKLVHDAWLISCQNAKKGVYKPLSPVMKVERKKEVKLATQSAELEDQIQICQDLNGEYNTDKKTCVFYNYDRIGASMVRARQNIAVKKLSRGLIDRAFGPEGKEQTIIDWGVAMEKGLAEDFRPKGGDN